MQNQNKGKQNKFIKKLNTMHYKPKQSKMTLICNENYNRVLQRELRQGNQISHELIKLDTANQNQGKQKQICDSI